MALACLFTGKLTGYYRQERFHTTREQEKTAPPPALLILRLVEKESYSRYCFGPDVAASSGLISYDRLERQFSAATVSL